MKLAITIELDVDLVAWGDTYDVRGARAIKLDVASYIHTAITGLDAALNEEILSNVEIFRVQERRQK